MSTETPSPTATPPPSHLSSLAAALGSAEALVLAQSFAEAGEEALALAASAPTERLQQFWLGLYESLQHEASVALAVTA